MRALLLTATAALGACAPGASRFDLRHPAHTKYQIHYETTEFDAGNGLHAVLLRDRHVDVVEVDVRYRVGSRDDPPGKEGLAHLVEHLMFEQRVGGPDQPSIGARLRERALLVNAVTSHDATHFMAQARNQRFEELLELEASRLTIGCRTITQEVFAREREVVREELLEKDADLTGRILAALYPPGHPYAHAAGGTSKGLDAVTLADACAFVDGYYTPDRALLVVAGDVEPARMSAAMAPLSRVPPRQAAPRRTVPAVAPHPGSVTLEADIDETVVMAAWPAPPTFSDEGEVAPIAARFLMLAARYSRRGRTWMRNARFEDIGAAVLGGVEAPFVVGTATVADPEYAAEVKTSVRERLFDVDFVVASFSSRDFERVKNERRMGLLMGLEPLSGRTAQVADWLQYRGAAGAEIAELLNRTDRLDQSAINARYARTLGADKITWIVIRPCRGGGEARRGGALPLRPAPSDELSVDAGEATHAIDVPDVARPQPARRLTLDNGLEVVLLPSAADIPMATARLSIRAGAADEPRGYDGMATMAAQQLYSEAVANNLRNYPIALTQWVDTERTTFEASGLGINLDAMLATLGSLMTEAEYLPEYWHSSEIREALGRPRARAAAVAERALREALFGADHPHAHVGVLLPESYDRIDYLDLHRFREQHYVARKARLVVTGAFDPAEAEALARRYLSAFPGGAPAATPPVPRVAGGQILGLVAPESATVQLRIGWIVDADDARLPARLVAARLLDRRMGALRERLAASYSPGASLEVLAGGGAYVAAAAVDPARAGVAIRVALEQAAALSRGDDLAADFVRARQATIEALATWSTTSGGRAARLDALVTPPLDDPAHLALAVARLTLDDMRAVLGADFAAGRAVLAVVGARPALEKAFAEAGVTARYVAAH